jgi:glycosyltransferase involved in cell wall biosynthesis
MTVVTPGRCGLYETTRELVAALREQGVDSRLVDPTLSTNKPNSLYPKGIEADRGALLADMDWALKADVIANHSGYDSTPVAKTAQPVIHFAHGRPRNSFLSEVKGSTPIYSYWYGKNRDPRFAAICTFWPEHKPYLDVMFPGKPVHVLPAPCDLDMWAFEGPSGYGFNGKKGRINIVITDHVADDVDQFLPLNAAILFAREVEGVKVHFYAHPQSVQEIVTTVEGKVTERKRALVVKRGFNALATRLKEEGHLGECVGWVKGLDNVYRAASMVLTANEIDTRTVREATACGCPVVQVTHLNDGWQVPLRKAMTMTREDRYIIRKRAEAKFNPKHAAIKFKDVAEKVGAVNA